MDIIVPSISIARKSRKSTFQKDLNQLIIYVLERNPRLYYYQVGDKS
jgi:hypothetical protein